MTHKPPPPGAEIVRTKRCDLCGEMIPVYNDPTPDGERRLVSNTSGCRVLRGMLPNVRVSRRRSST